MIEITLEGPAKNALSTEVLTSLRAAVRAAAGAPLVLHGAGDAFSAGLHLREIASFDTAGMQRFLELLVGTVEELYHYPGPVVAAVNGHAIAGGCVIAAAADHRVATTDPRARIGLNEVALGLRFPPRLLAIIRQRVAAVETVVLDGGLYAPQDALRYGLVDELADDPIAAARARAQARAAHPAAIYAATKADLRRATPVDAGADQRFRDEILPIWASDEVRARIAAFLDRKPRA